MKPKHSRNLSILGAIVFTANAAYADNGIWTATTDGLWSDTANWASATVADGSGFAADFSTIDPTADVLVSLDSPRTLSSLVFADTDTVTPANWLIDNNGDALNVLTLDGAPTITVNALGAGARAEISAIVSSSVGLTKEGAGQLSLTGANSITGTTTVNAGKLVFTEMPASDSYSIAAGATLEIARATDQSRNIKDLTISGGGTFLKSGAGLLLLSRFQGDSTPYVWSLANGAQIRVEGGKFQVSDYNTNSDFSNNHSSLFIGSGATFEALQANVTIDALEGEGTYQGGWFGARKLTVGIDGGSGTFSGTLQGNGNGGAVASVPLLKRGNGSQVLDGTLNFRGAGGIPSIEVRDGTLASPSSLTISPAGSSVIGVDTLPIYFSSGTNDVTEVTHTAGTLIASTFGIGENSQSTYNFSGGMVNAKFLSFAFSGGGNNGPAIMNISDSAQMNVLSNGDIRMGVFWGRNVTVNQTGGEVIQYSDAGVTRGGTGKLNFNGNNQNLTWNLEAGTLSLAGMAWQPSGGGAGGGNGIINFNGGTLQITNAAFAVPTGDANGKPVVSLNVLGDDLTPDSGATIDNYGLDVNIAAGILHGPTSTFDGGLKLATSVAGGSLTLQGINTYTGNTTVDAGNTLVLASGAQLQFTLDATFNNKLTGAGTATLDGAFNIDTTYGETTPGTEWTLVDIASKTYGGTFSVTGFTNNSGVWSYDDGFGSTWTFTQSTGKLTVADTVLGGYASWIGGFTVSDPSEGGDPDHDGIANLVEYVLQNGDPSVVDTSILPTSDASGLNFVFTFYRRQDSAADTVQSFEYGTNLVSWSSLAIPGGAGVVVTPDDPVAGIDKVEITVAKGSNTQMFGRLNVQTTP